MIYFYSNIRGFVLLPALLFLLLTNLIIASIYSNTSYLIKNQSFTIQGEKLIDNTTNCSIETELCKVEINSKTHLYEDSSLKKNKLSILIPNTNKISIASWKNLQKLNKNFNCTWQKTFQKFSNYICKSNLNTIEYSIYTDGNYHSDINTFINSKENIIIANKGSFSINGNLEIKKTTNKTQVIQIISGGNITLDFLDSIPENSILLLHSVLGKINISIDPNTFLAETLCLESKKGITINSLNIPHERIGNCSFIRDIEYWNREILVGL